MAKKSKPQTPKPLTKKQIRYQELRWRAESIVRDSMIDTPAFKKAVRQTIRELEKVEREARKTLRKP